MNVIATNYNAHCMSVSLSFYCVFLFIISLYFCVCFMFYVLPVGVINDNDITSVKYQIKGLP